MPIDYKQYPPNWLTEIRPAILARAGEIRDAGGAIIQEASCEFCGVPNHTWVLRKKTVDFREIEYAGTSKSVPVNDWIECYEGEGRRVIITTAHLDRDKTNNNLFNLAALCQRCHLNHDRVAQHIPNRKFGKGREEQPKLF